MPHKLLLADDSITIQRVIELTFADEDVRVSAVGDGQQAIERIEADPPDIVLADVGMPKCDGYEVAAYVKSRPQLAHIPVVLLTGAFEPVDQARASAAGCDGVLAKPFEPQMVINRVKQLLGGKRAAAAARPVAAAPALRAARPAAVAPGERTADLTQPAPEPFTDPAAGLSLDAVRPQVNTAGPNASLDDYFDQLDAAFSQLGTSPAADEGGDQTPMAWSHGGGVEGVLTPAGDAPAEREEPVGHAAGLSQTRDEEGDVFGWAPPAPASMAEPDHLDFSGVTGLDADPAAAPVSVMESVVVASAPPMLEWEASNRPQGTDERDAIPASAAPWAPAEPSGRASAPIADAFAALLAAEESDAPATPVTSAPGSPAGAIVITEELIERVSRHVLERLSDKVVRDTVREMVSWIAERLVREEIERIKRGM